MEQHMYYTFHHVNKRFSDMQQQHDSDMATLADSVVQVGQRVDTLATDMSRQMQNVTTMLHTLMAHVGIAPQLQFQTPAAAAHPAHPPPFQLGSRHLHRQGTGSRSPRRDGEDFGHNDGIPDLPPTFSFETPAA